MEIELGSFWLPDGDVLTARFFWSSLAIDVDEFEGVSRGMRFPRGSGLPGAVWSSGTPLCVANVADLPGRSRSEAAVAAGLRGALAFPALHDGNVIAVLEFFSRERIELTDRLNRSLVGSGYQLGQFLHRRRGEIDSRVLTSARSRCSSSRRGASRASRSPSGSWSARRP